MNDILELKNEIILAESRIRPYVRETVLEHAPWLELHGARIFCKLENLQHTGSFKIRGAFNKLLSLSRAERSRGVVAASTGNHGLAVAFALNVLGARGIVFVPESVANEKADAIERMGAEVRRYGDDTAQTESYARQYAVENKMTFVSPYNDQKIIAGQGTIGLEICHQLNEIDAVFVSLGGGGLITGIASCLKSVNPNVRIIGCSPVNSQIMIKSIRAGRILDLPSLPTLSDGTAGGIEPEAITFNFCRKLVDDFVTITEDEIKVSLRQFILNQHMLIEGAAAVSLASYLKLARDLAGATVVIVICGANITSDALAHIFAP